MLRLGQSAGSGGPTLLHLLFQGPKVTRTLPAPIKSPRAGEASGKQKAGCLWCSYFLLGNSNPLRQRSKKVCHFLKLQRVGAVTAYTCVLEQSLCCSMEHRRGSEHNFCPKDISAVTVSNFGGYLHRVRESLCL